MWGLDLAIVWRSSLPLLASVRTNTVTDVLANPTRSRIFEKIRERPGLPMRDLSRAASAPWGTVKYHVLLLEAAGLVGMRKAGRRVVVFPLDMPAPEIAAARAILLEPTARAVATLIADHDGISIIAVQKESGLSQRVVYYHVKNFIETALIERADGRTYRNLRPTATLLAALNERREGE